MKAISRVSGRWLGVEQAEEDVAAQSGDLQLDLQRWYWWRQDRFDPRGLEEELGVEMTRIEGFLGRNLKGVKGTFGES